MKLWIIPLTSGSQTFDSLNRILAKIFSWRLLLQLWIGNLGRSEDYQQNRRHNITNPASTSIYTWIHSLKLTFEACNNVDIRLILKGVFSPSTCHTEDVLTARVTALLPHSAVSCCAVSTAFSWACLSEKYCVDLLCTAQRVWPTYPPSQRLHLTLIIAKNRLLYTI